MLTPFIVVREPAEGWACATVTFAGIAGSLVGLNGNGLAASAGVVLNAGDQRQRRLSRWIAPANRRTIGSKRSARTGRGRSAERPFAARMDGLSEPSGRKPVSTPRSTTARAWRCATAAIRWSRPTIACCRPAPLPAPTDSLSRLAWIEAAVGRATRSARRRRIAGGLGRDAHQGNHARVDRGRCRARRPAARLRRRSRAGSRRRPVAECPGGTRDKSDSAAPVARRLNAAGSDDLVVDATEGESMRFVMRARPFPWQTQPADFPQWKGAAAIQGQGPLADALQRRLEAGGATVVRLRDRSFARGGRRGIRTRRQSAADPALVHHVASRRPGRRSNAAGSVGPAVRAPSDRALFRRAAHVADRRRGRRHGRLQRRGRR